MFASGELQRLIDLGLRGMTSNPTIFEKAIGSSDYDEQLGELVDESDAQKVFEALAIRDIRSACDLFRPVWEATEGLDGYVSLEVPPTLANDTQGTIAAAQRLWKAVDRPNVMIKIPGTAAGTPGDQGLDRGRDQRQRDAAVLGRPLRERGERLHRRARGPRCAGAAGRPYRVGRVGLRIAHRQCRRQKGAGQDRRRRTPRAAAREAAIASTKLTYQRFLKLVGTERFDALRAKGARVQRPLWASTSTKNPAYPDLMYVDNLIGRDTVNTVPPNTLEAMLDHGKVQADTVLGTSTAPARWSRRSPKRRSRSTT